MRISDLLTNYILDMMNDENSIELKRNELAITFGCVPSQINYVLTSRFTPEQGYIVESRRGGGGYIKITRINMDKASTIMHIINSLGDAINYKTSIIVLNNLFAQNILDEYTFKLISVAINDSCYKNIPYEYRDVARCSILKNLLLAQV